MSESLFKRISIKTIAIFLAIFIIGIGIGIASGIRIGYFYYPYKEIKQEMIQEIESQIAWMESMGVDNTSYKKDENIYIGNIEGQKFMLNIIKKLKPNMSEDLKEATWPDSHVEIRIGNVVMEDAWNGYWFHEYRYQSFIMDDKERKAFDAFVSDLERK